MERRNQQRFKATGDIAVESYKNNLRLFKWLKRRPAKSAQLIDISLSGLAFEYHDSQMWSHDFDTLTICVSAEAKVEQVAFKPISDIMISGGFNTQGLRRCGVKFEGLSRGIMLQLKAFIQNHTVNRREGEDRRVGSGLPYNGPERRGGVDRRAQPDSQL